MAAVRRSPLRGLLRWLLSGLFAVFAVGALLQLLIQPSNQRDWSPDQAQLASASFDGDQVIVRNVRNTRYRSSEDYDLHWETRSYDLRPLTRLWYVVEPFDDWRGPAHTLLSFGFGDGRHLAISVEIRRERGEAFSPLQGLLRQFELAYVVGDERDLIGLRAVHRGDAVHLYPLRAEPAVIRALLVDMLASANQLAEQPRFYNTLTANCTSTLLDHVEALAPGRIGLTWRAQLPGYSDDLAFDLGLIDTDLGRESFRAAHRIDDDARRAEQAGLEGVAYSAALRARWAGSMSNSDNR